MARVGRFRATDGARYARGRRVIVRTERGLEVGEVLGDEAVADADGVLLRAMTDADELLAERLNRKRDAAYASCVELLRSRDSDEVLLDVEHLFDGRGLYFYFLGGPTSETESLITELAAAYEAEARVGEFAETLEQGCGPGCGTEEAAGGGCDTCTGCAVAAACGVRPAD